MPSSEHKPTSVLSVPDDVARTVFDVAVNSLDFGSGFLDHSEVTALRRLAVLLGVDESKATPHEMTCDFNPPHEWGPWESISWRPGEEFQRCSKCGKSNYREVQRVS